MLPALPALGPKRAIYLFTSSLFVLAVALYLRFAGFPVLIGSKIKHGIVLNNGTAGMEAFAKLSHPLEFRIYIFNVTNPEEVTKGAKPVLNEVGPYIYDEEKNKLNLQEAGEDMLTYVEEKVYYFNEKKSGSLKESDELTVLNIPLMGMGYMVEEKFPLGLTFLNSAVPFLFPNVSSPFLRVSVGELLFSGIRISCDHETGPAMPVCRGIRSNRPPPIREIPGSKDFAFSIFHKVNGSQSGLFKVLRGNKNIHDRGRIVEYDNQTYLSMWDRNSSCSLLRGTDSTVLPPITHREDLYIYLSEVCLSLRAKYVGEMGMYGIHIYKYVSVPENFASATEVPENICRCRKLEDKPNPVCLKSGAIDATNCQGAPVIFTPVHFLDCDKEYQSYAEGLSPDKSKHETQLFLEPRTGAPLAAYKRIQMNMFLRRLEGIDLLANVSQGLFPLIWVEERIPEEMLHDFLPALQSLSSSVKIMNILCWLLAGLGAIGLAFSVGLYLKYNRMYCFKENKVVSNVAVPIPEDLGGKGFSDEKRTVYNIGVKHNENNQIPYSSTEMFSRNNNS